MLVMATARTAKSFATEKLIMSTQAKPSIVFMHGIWADGSCFSKVIPRLQAEGREVMPAQYDLDSLAGDVAADTISPSRSIASWR